MRRPVEIALVTDDVVTARRFYEGLLGAAPADLLVGRREYPWASSAYRRDPDGRLLELSQR